MTQELLAELRSIDPNRAEGLEAYIAEKNGG